MRSFFKITDWHTGSTDCLDLILVQVLPLQSMQVAPLEVILYLNFFDGQNSVKYGYKNHVTCSYQSPPILKKKHLKSIQGLEFFIGLVDSSRNRLVSTVQQKKDFEKKNGPNRPKRLAPSLDNRHPGASRLGRY